MAQQKLDNPVLNSVVGGLLSNSVYSLSKLDWLGVMTAQHSTDNTHKPVTCQKSRAIAIVRVVAAVSGVPEHAGSLSEVGLRVVKAERVGGEGVQPPCEASGHTGVRPSW